MSQSGIFHIRTSYRVNSCNTLDNQMMNQPIAVALDGTYMANYVNGLFSNCGTHLSITGLLVSVFDSFYRVKMSWGTHWGEDGYIRMPRYNNICGICMDASYPVVQ